MTLTGTQIRDVLNQQFTVSRMLQISGLTYTWQNNAVVDIFLPGGAALARACGVEQLFDNSGSAAFRRPDKA